MPKRTDKLWRLIKLIGLMQSARAYTADQMAELLEVATRTIYRDLESLNEAGVPFYCDRGYRLHSKFFMKPIQFEFDEALALHLAAQALGGKPDSPYRSPAERALAKVEEALPWRTRELLVDARLSFDIDPQPVVDMSNHRQTFGTLEEAAIRKRRLEVTYYSIGSDEECQRQLDPYGLFYRWRAWYLVAYCHLRGEIRMFRVDRIRKIRIVPEFFSRPDSFNLEQYLDGVWRVERGEEKNIAIWFSRDWARWICEGEWHPSQTIDRKDDGSIVIRITTGSVGEMKRWVLGFGPGARVLEPESLVKEMARDTQEMAREYT